jgi:L-lysine 6-transaminase
MGLTGEMWASKHMNIVPDIICFGKKAQVCGFMATNRIDEVPDNVFKVESRISSTWGGNLVDMTRSQKLIEIMMEEALVNNAAVMGEYLLMQLHDLAKLYSNKMSNVRGRGLMCAFDLASSQMCSELKKLAYEKQLLIISCGTQSIRLRPLLDVTQMDINKLIFILHQCLKEIRE